MQSADRFLRSQRALSAFGSILKATNLAVSMHLQTPA
jgi:hypothetical protein